MATPSETLTLLTWNIYGLQSAHLRERTDYIIKYIQERTPAVVFLQEVVPHTWPTLTAQLGGSGGYQCYCGTPKAHYFPAVLVRKDISCRDQTVIDFPSSMQGRYLIQVPIMYNGKDISLLCSHIESMDKAANIAERKKQLKMAFDKMEELGKSGSVTIFGGDTNTFDTEIEDIGLPEQVKDVWVFLGSDKKKGKTWNTNVLIHRPDRVYFGPTEGPVTPVTFDLIGNERIPRLGCYPSDHLGIWIDFDMK